MDTDEALGDCVGWMEGSSVEATLVSSVGDIVGDVDCIGVMLGGKTLGISVRIAVGCLAV